MSYYEEEETPLFWSDYEHAKDHLQGLVDDIYKTGSIEDLEFHLEEVLGIFGLKIPSTEVVLQKKPTEEEQSTDRMLKSWVGEMATRHLDDILSSDPDYLYNIMMDWLESAYGVC